jgi:hypothetical protein
MNKNSTGIERLVAQRGVFAFARQRKPQRIAPLSCAA